MIDAYGWATPNGNKLVIMLEECGLPYRFIPVNLPYGEQRSEAFVSLNPFGKIPVLVDPDSPGGPLTLAESGAILIYLARKTHRFLPQEIAAEAQVMKWLMFLTAHVGPSIGQLHHFVSLAAPIAYATARFTDESHRILSLLDRQVMNNEHLAGEEYTIADIATWPWVRSWQYTLGNSLENYDALRRWFEMIAARPAVCRAIQRHDELKRKAATS